ncbi:MAG: 5-formyltetrahydrofolate cyclo-ligase [Candidatus Acidulodesulfobacterium sp.]
MINKKDARELMKNKRIELTEPFINSASLNIAKLAYDCIVLNLFKKIAIYMSIKKEVRIEYLIGLNKGEDMQLFMPVCENDGHMGFYKFESMESMKRDSFGIICPKNGHKIDEKDIDVFFVPGLAFDIYGNRVGYGKGCFDRSLKKTADSYFIGVCYDFQFIKNDVLESEPEDVKMNFIITENGIFKIDQAL